VTRPKEELIYWLEVGLSVIVISNCQQIKSYNYRDRFLSLSVFVKIKTNKHCCSNNVLES